MANFLVQTKMVLQSKLFIDTGQKKAPYNNLPLLGLVPNLQITNYDIKTSKALLLLRIGLMGF
jgi:outer membrane protein